MGRICLVFFFLQLLWFRGASGVWESTNLEKNRLNAAYRKQLQIGHSLLDLWLKVTGESLEDWSENLGEANGKLASFVQWCHDGQHNYNQALHAILVLQNRFPALRKGLHRPWDAIRRWRLEKSGEHRLPIPLELLQATFSIGVCEKRIFDSRKKREAKIYCSLRFSFPRIGDILADPNSAWCEMLEQ